MYCKRCGKQLPENAKFCKYCGADVTEPEASYEGQPYPAYPVPEPVDREPVSAPQKRSGRGKRADKPPNIFIRVLFFLLAAVMLVTSLVTIIVLAAGKTTDYKIVSSDRNRLDRKSHSWNVTYEFYVDGKLYTGSATLKGGGYQSELKKRHLLYLPFLPQMNRLTNVSSLAAADNAGEVLKTVFYMAISFAFGSALSYVFLHVAFPGLPFFSGRKRKRKMT